MILDPKISENGRKAAFLTPEIGYLDPKISKIEKMTETQLKHRESALEEAGYHKSRNTSHVHNPIQTQRKIMTEIICGDSTKILESIDIRPTLICCDPPYLIPSIQGGGIMNTKCSLVKSLKALKSKDFDITAGYNIRSFAKTVDRLQRGNINAYFFCNKLQIPEYLQVYVTEMKCKFDLLSWHKTNPPPTYSNKYLSDTEYILFFHKGKGHTKPKNYNCAKTYWTQPINVIDKKTYEHPTIKPLNIVKTLVENSSSPGDLVLDPFCGSGTTGVACAQLRRDFLGIEISPKYVQIAIKRIADIDNDSCDQEIIKTLTPYLS